MESEQARIIIRRQAERYTLRLWQVMATMHAAARGIHISHGLTQSPVMRQAFSWELPKLAREWHDWKALNESYIGHINFNVFDEELAQDFPIIRSQALILLCSTLETFIEDFLADWLTIRPELMDQSPFKDVTLTLSQWEAFSDRDERLRFLIREAKPKGEVAYLQRGLAGMQEFLRGVGLHGGLDPAMRKDVWEAFKIRNAIVHRGARADKRLIQACPDLGLTVGDSVKVGSDAIDRYYTAILEYGGVVMDRALESVDATEQGKPD